MCFNNFDIGPYRDLYNRIDLNKKPNTNILYDYCQFENESIYKELFNKDITIDALSTIEQMKDFYGDVIYDYDGEYIRIKRRSLNRWNKLLTKIFKFYGWYPKDEKTLYPKYDIVDLKKYLNYN